MPSNIWPQPMVVVRDVEASSGFYQQVLGAESGHGGPEYDQLLVDGELVLQLHALTVGHHHGRLADAGQSLGNGILLWFETADFDAAVARVAAAGAAVECDVELNPNANQLEIWFRDPDGYLVVLAGPTPYRPRLDT